MSDYRNYTVAAVGHNAHRPTRTNRASCRSAGRITLSQELQLIKAVERFRQWADSTFSGQKNGEWECEYEEWGDLYDSVRAVLRTEIEGWNDLTKQLLIYAIARDNEVGLICDELTEEQLMVLSAASMSSDERDAKWQFAEHLGKHPLTNQREKLLLELAVDADENVRRRSLMALADTGSGRAEQLAITAWHSGEEYQQMACLHALWRINSPLLPRYLEPAEQDTRRFLKGMAERIRNGTGEFAQQ